LCRVISPREKEAKRTEKDEKATRWRAPFLVWRAPFSVVLYDSVPGTGPAGPENGDKKTPQKTGETGDRRDAHSHSLLPINRHK
jgi:hypothetical protein